jgi:hypothetical protein
MGSVVADHAGVRSVKIPRHRLAHQPKPGEANGLVL